MNPKTPFMRRKDEPSMDIRAMLWKRVLDPTHNKLDCDYRTNDTRDFFNRKTFLVQRQVSNFIWMKINPPWAT